MNRLSRLVAVLSLAALPLAAAPTTSEWTGYLTDTHCGKKMASKEHSDACIEKCVKSGSKVHIVAESDEKMYELDDASKVKGMAGKRITVKGTLDAEKNQIKVDSAAPAAEKK